MILTGLAIAAGAAFLGGAYAVKKVSGQEFEKQKEVAERRQRREDGLLLAEYLSE